MKDWTLPIIIRHFDDFVKNVDFCNLPDKDSEEYRELLLKTANDEIFPDGRYSTITEWILEMFDVELVNELVSSLTEIDALTDSQRVRLGFYMDLKSVCYPLFRAKTIAWDEWPWNMTRKENSLFNRELYNFIADGKYPYLSAAILYAIETCMMRQDDEYTCVERNEASQVFHYGVESSWSDGYETEDERNEFCAKITKCADDLWAIENHHRVGKQLGMEWLELSVYDAMDTFVDTMFRSNQVDFAFEFADWIRANMTIGEEHPEKEKVEAFDKKLHELMDKHDVSTSDFSYTWLILTLDVLGVALCSDEDESL